MIGGTQTRQILAFEEVVARLDVTEPDERPPVVRESREEVLADDQLGERRESGQTWYLTLESIHL